MKFLLAGDIHGLAALIYTCSEARDLREGVNSIRIGLLHVSNCDTF